MDVNDIFKHVIKDNKLDYIAYTSNKVLLGYIRGQQKSRHMHMHLIN